ncbi:hypothetical protein [Luteipulveratus mongoliensis]|uniref:hypothetical protein n=1 Tax=Luteipulveratus mongoliensis TaxID=571913 RepID=UPI0012EE9720|nr:hypothetical protein [Luteipulveratus mongoliensis]
MNPYRLACNVLMTLAGMCLLAAIWLLGSWWQWLLTGLVLTFLAGFANSEADKREGQ